MFNRSSAMKIAKAVVISLIIILTAVFSFEYNLKQQFARSVDDPDGTVTIKGLADKVTVRRDRLGVPYIEAKNEEDLFFATGYVTASDRLWQMTVMKMAMSGRLSEIIGPEGLKTDLFMRSLGAGDVIDEALKKMDPAMMRILECYSRGVNAYVKSHAVLPAEFQILGFRPEPWEPRDSLYVTAMMGLNLSFNFIEELDFLNLAARVGYEKAAYLVPVYPGDDLPFDEAKKLSEIDRRALNRMSRGWNGVRDGLRELFSIGIPASNNWALAGTRTKSGRPIVCNDTHLALMMPNAWFMMHQKCPGFESAGVASPGVPIISLGYNGRVAWGATMVMADNQDIFVEQIKEIDGVPNYLYKGKWVPARIKTETFRVKDGRTITRKIKYTGHGPVLNDALSIITMPPELTVQPLPVKSDYALALSWGVGDLPRTLLAFLDINRAQSAADARKAVLGLEGTYLNIVYGDADNIGWQVTGKFPKRKKGTGQLPSPGWTGDYDWDGFTASDANPHAENPAQGYIATANNRTVDKKFPLNMSSCWYNPERAERLQQVLGPIKNATAGEMMKLQFDRYSLMSKKVQDLLFRGESAKKLRAAMKSLGEEKAGNVREALEFLKPERFNNIMAEDSAGAAVMGAFMHAATRCIFLDELGPEGSVAWESFQDASVISYSAFQDHLLGREDSPFWDNITTKRKETKWIVLAQALSDAILLCEDRMGSARRKWEWGKLHTYHWKHDFTKKLPVFHDFFNRGPYPAGGDGHTLNVATPVWGSDFNVVVIPAMRMVVDFGLKEPAYLVHTPGQSGNPSSGHYDDMLPYWLNGKNHPLPFGRKAVEEQYEDVLVLKPGKTR